MLLAIAPVSLHDDQCLEINQAFPSPCTDLFSAIRQRKRTDDEMQDGKRNCFKAKPGRLRAIIRASVSREQERSRSNSRPGSLPALPLTPKVQLFCQETYTHSPRFSFRSPHLHPHTPRAVKHKRLWRHHYLIERRRNSKCCCTAFASTTVAHA